MHSESILSGVKQLRPVFLSSPSPVIDLLSQAPGRMVLANGSGSLDRIPRVNISGQSHDP
jgi:hypothetical protein